MLAKRFRTLNMLRPVALLSVLSIAGCTGLLRDLFPGGDEGDTTAPTVNSTTPARSATDVAINARIAATFSEAMDPSTITDAHFTVTGSGATSIPATVTFDETANIVTLTPSGTLAPNTTFSATIAGVTDLAGNGLKGDVVWSFTTGTMLDTTAPTVRSTIPVDAAPGVALNATITASFSEIVDPSTVSSATFLVTGPGLTAVAGTVAYAAASNAATFIATSTLAPGATFTASLTTDIKDLAGNALAGNFVWSFTTQSSTGPAYVNLGSASTFVVLAGSAISNTGATILNGDLGVSPSATVNGFPPGVVNGTMNAADAGAAQAKLDLTAAFLDAQGRSVGTQTLPGNLGGLTFAPGLYTNSTSVLISGSGPGNDVTLDAQGDANAIFVFQMGSTLTTGPASQVILSGGAKAANVYWQVGTSATLDTTSVFKGTILAQTSITLKTGATLDGRALAQNGAVTLDSNTVTTPAP